ncbi:DUF4169 family protein [uncultured Tateyamaria sp.]|uniref:DUF4169 family protein n=1 Tax=uncultured Tateyamaria sp. TaxID=455651 RepID=UPI0026306270|nr:DUF4169 family protein [uncultured Tateyamaria sp.]
MTRPINLNKARKARARAEKTARAEANVVAFGRTKAEKQHAERETARMTRELDGKALETSANGAKDGNKKP